MSSCTNIKDQIEMMLMENAQELPLELETHLKTCVECRKYYEKSRQIQAAFLNIRKEKEICPESIINQFEAKLESLERKTLFSRFFDFFTPKIVFASGAAVFLLFISLYFVPGKYNEAKPVLIAQADASRNDPLTITIDYNAEQMLDNVDFSIKLPQGVAFYSSDEEIKKKTSHAWKGSLKKGLNSIPFIVFAEKEGVMEILTEATYSGMKFAHKIVLNVEKEKISVAYFEYKPVREIR